MRLFAGTEWDTNPKCDSCQQEIDKCECPPAEPPKGPVVAPEKQKIKIRKEKRKKGKVVTCLRGFSFATNEDRDSLLKKLKNECGAGGTIAGDGDELTLEIQGDHGERLQKILAQMGYQVKIVG